MTDRVIRIVFDTTRANQQADTFKGKLEGVQREAKQTESSLSAVKAAAAAAFVAAAVRQVIAYGDAMQRLQNRLKLVTDSQRELNEVQGRLFEIAQRTATPLNDLAELYTRTSQATKDLGVSQDELLTITEAVANAARVSGSTQAEAAGAIRQFTQALAGGVLRAEEFNSIIEGTPRLAQALSDAFGVTSGELRQLVNDGRITSENIADAILAQADVLREEFGSATLTVEDNLTRLDNAAQVAFAQFDEGAGITETVSKRLDELATFLSENELLFQTLGEGASRLFKLLENGITIVRILAEGFTTLGEIAGAAAADGLDGAADAARRATGRLQELADQLKTTDDIEREIAEARKRRLIDSGEPEIAPGLRGTQDLGDGGGTVRPTGTGNSRGRGGGRRRTPAQEAAQFVEQLAREAEQAGKTRAEVAQLKLERLGASQALQDQAAAHVEYIENVKAAADAERDAAQAAERRAQQLAQNQAADARFAESLQIQLNMLQLTSAEQERYAAQLQLSADATDEQRQAVDDLVVSLQAQRAANEEAAAQFQQGQQFAEDFTSTIADGLARAITSGDSFKDVLKSIVAQLLQMILRYQTLNPLQEQFARSANSIGGGGGGGGFFESLFGGFFGGGGGGGGGGFGAPPPIPDVVTGPFARGGSFIVPNTGGSGVDSERIMFDATAGERVTVEPVNARAPEVNIEIINTTGEPVETQQATALDGERQIRVLIGQAINELDASGERDIAQRQTYGAVRRGVVR